MSDTNYKATVVALKNIRKHENADRLQIATIYGNSVIVGLDAKVGDVGLFFPLESQIGLEFAIANDLLRRKNPETGKVEGGMFDDNRRVRAQSLRGEKSMGFWIPISSLKKLEQGFDTQIEDLKDGEEISEFNGKIISQKYVPKTSRTEGNSKDNKGGKQKTSKVIESQFRFHKDTAQLGKNLHKISPEDIIAVTYKYHGTSAIASRVLVKRDLKWFEKLLLKIKINIPTTQYEYLYASRTVIKNDSNKDGGYYGEDLWVEKGKQLFEGNLKQGETIYYELVGYTKSGKEIQKGYPYQQHVGQCAAIVYRVTYTLADGTVIELPWNQVEERCKQLGVKSALTLYYGKAEDMYPEITAENLDSWRDQFLKKLQDEYLEKDCLFHAKGVPAEGICVRKEGLDLETFKLKSFRFLEGETKALDQGEIDLETEQSEANEN